MNRFPKDCWEKNCPHFHTVDMSIDDLLCRCDLLNEECDACDGNFSFARFRFSRIRHENNMGG